MKHRPISRRRRSSTKSVMRLLDLEHAKTAVLNSLTSSDAQRGYRHAIDEFVDWYCSEPRLAFNRIVVLRYRSHLESRQLAPGTINLVALTLDHLQQREEHWAIVDLVGKGGHIRTVPVPDWVRNELDEWLDAAEINRGRVFRRVSKAGKTWGEGMTEKAVWHIVKEAANRAGVAKLAPHDLRRTCARLCHTSGGELEQIQFLLGHISVQTTERYLGCKQRIRSAVNDRIGIEPAP
jgi:hypothetical protein